MTKRPVPAWVKAKADAAAKRSAEKAGIHKPKIERIRLKAKDPIEEDEEPEDGGSKVGRPSKFDKKYIGQAKRMKEAGSTEYEIAHILGVAHSTMWRWACYNKEFRSALDTPKQDLKANDRVREAIYASAVGFERNGQYFAPNPATLRLWARNKMRDEFPDHTSLTGANGGPIQTQVVDIDPNALDNLTPQELAVLEKILGAKRSTQPASVDAQPDLATREERKQRDALAAKPYAETLH